ncbi:MAG: hypothetical protein JO013_13700 [Alphaproteobacteria bacterium]|nr:hypothetical protein [Alphaproteobacteria bacterium]
MDELVGTWEKRAGPACAARYPRTLSLLPGGHYRGQADAPGEYTHWDVGTWRVVGPGELAVSTANDAVRRYGFRLDGDRLLVRDEQGCEFAYDRAEVA